MTVEKLGQAVELYRRTSTSRSAILLVVANLIPLFGVLFLGWSLWTILVLYWVENGIVGFWNIPKLLLAQGSFVPTMPELPDAAARAATGGNASAAAQLQAAWQRARAAQIQAAATGADGAPAQAPALGRARVFGQPVGGSAGRAGLAIFFLMHYGIFWLVHGLFIFLLPTFFGAGIGPVCEISDELPNPLGVDPAGCGFGELVWSNVVIAGIALFISHGASFLFNYIGRGEYLTASPMGQMGAPYGRVVVLHLTIIFGTFIVAGLGAPIGPLLILVVLKTALDLGLHLRERRKADARVPADTAYAQAIRGG
jgi:hypothetical protein